MRSVLSQIADELNAYVEGKGYECHAVCSDDRVYLWFQTARVERAVDVDRKRDKLCRQEMTLQLLAHGVMGIGGGTCVFNASLTDEDVSMLLNAMRNSLDNLHSDGML